MRFYAPAQIEIKEPTALNAKPDLFPFLSEGPLTGRELRSKSGISELPLWRACSSSPGIVSRTFGTRYLRLDRAVEGYARLSPSIKREFLTYTVIGLEKDLPEIERMIASLRAKFKAVSGEKFMLALGTVKRAVESLEDRDSVMSRSCFIIAGDVVYDMAHTEPRPECSTGELVRGSDLDIIIITEGLPGNVLSALDKAVYREKYYLLKHPSYQEEIDYIIKDTAAVSRQLQFDTFKSMVACKILDEGRFLYGNELVFSKIKGMLLEKGLPARLKDMEARASSDRKDAELSLLRGNGAFPDGGFMKLFYTKEESEEIF